MQEMLSVWTAAPPASRKWWLQEALVNVSWVNEGLKAWVQTGCLALHTWGPQMEGGVTSTPTPSPGCFSIWLCASLVCKDGIRKGTGEVIFLLAYLKNLADFFLSWSVYQWRMPTLFWKQEFPWQPASHSTISGLSKGLWATPSLISPYQPPIL